MQAPALVKYSWYAYQKIFYVDNPEANLTTNINSPERSRRIFLPLLSGVEKRVSLKVAIMNYFASMLYNTQQEAYYLYIILCNDGTFYTGLTDDLVKRFEEHVNGVYETCYTFKRSPLV